MNLVPAWAPNIHPLLVHFPIALLCAAAAVDLVGWALRRNKPLRQAATLLYGLGTGGAIAAYVTGRAASQTIWFQGMAQAVLGQHWNWAFRTVWFFGIVTVARVVFLRPSRHDPGPSIVATFALVGLVGIGLLIETGDRDPGAGASFAGIVSQRWSAMTVHLNGTVLITHNHTLGGAAGAIVEGPSQWSVRPVAEAVLEQNDGRTVSGVVGAIWQVRKGLSLDAGLRIARADGATLREFRAGFTWAVPIKSGGEARRPGSSGLPPRWRPRA